MDHAPQPLARSGDDDDRELVERARAGDEGAFAQLVTRYEGRVYNLALRYCGDVHEAGDLAQEAFLRVYRGLSGFRGTARFSTWLYRIVINVCRDWERKRRRRPTVAWPTVDDGDRPKDLPDPAPGPEEVSADNELRRRVVQEIAQLPQEYRQAVLLRDVQDLSYGEIAHILQVSVGTVKSRIHRGRAALRDRLAAAGLLPPGSGAGRGEDDGP